MAVSTSYAPIQSNGNDVTVAFSVTWQFFDSTLIVTLISSAGVETVKTITTHYTVAGGTDANGLPATGTVTMLTAPATGEKLRIERSTPLTQSTSYTTNDAFPAKTTEAALDRALLRDQEVSYQARSRALLISTANEIAGVDPVLPTVVDNAGCAIVVNDDENGFQFASLSGIDLTIGTVTTGAAGTDAEASITGTAPDLELNLTIPRGNTGASGAGTGDMLAANNLSDVASAATSRTNLGVGTGDSPLFTGVSIGNADTTLTRTGAGDVAIEGNGIYRAGGTDVPVADGGTGVSSLTAYAVICGGTTSTGAVQSIASVGSSGQVLTSNGAGALPTFQAAVGASKAADQQTFTSSDTWTKPSGFSSDAYVLIECWGGGGGGGRANSGGNAGGGGGGGYAQRFILLSALGSTETVTIGAGGAGGASNDTNGSAGGTTTFGAHLSAYGGGGGGRAANNASAGGGAGGYWGAVGGTAAESGAQTPDTNPWVGGVGANIQAACCSETTHVASGSLMGGGGGGGKENATTLTAGASVGGGNGGASGSAGTQPGGGGGGNVNATAGAGAAGKCVVTVFDGA